MVVFAEIITNDSLLLVWMSLQTSWREAGFAVSDHIAHREHCPSHAAYDGNSVRFQLGSGGGGYGRIFRRGSLLWACGVQYDRREIEEYSHPGPMLFGPELPQLEIPASHRASRSQKRAASAEPHQDETWRFSTFTKPVGLYPRP